MTLLGRSPNSEEEVGPSLAANLAISPGSEGTAAEERLTFGDGILLVHRPQQLRGKDRELPQPQERGRPPGRLLSPGLGIGGEHLRARGQNSSPANELRGGPGGITESRIL